MIHVVPFFFLTSPLYFRLELNGSLKEKEVRRQGDSFFILFLFLNLFKFLNVISKQFQLKQ